MGNAARTMRWKTMVGAAGLMLTVSLSGCGGGGHSTPAVTRTAPTAATRARVQSFYSQGVRASALSGSQTLGMAQARVGVGAVAGVVAGGGAGTSSSDSAAPAHSGVPYLGAFFRQNSQRGGATAANAPSRKHSRQEDADSNFYFDYYLGLWVQLDDTPTKTTYTLYEDETKQTPAGSIVTENPADYDTYPQTYRSSYTFTAGTLKGSHGFYNSTTRADYGGTSDYENVYADGGKDSGTSSWSSNGASTYKSREDLAGGAWNESVGTYREDGSGGTRYKSSDGYGADYTFNADGTGRGKITGSDPGLPAIIVWDGYGNTTITYADGTVEHLDYGFGYGVADATTDGGINDGGFSQETEPTPSPSSGLPPAPPAA